MGSINLRSLELSIERASPFVSPGEARVEVMTLRSFFNRNLLKPTASRILFLCRPCYGSLLYLRVEFVIRGRRILPRAILLQSVEIHSTKLEILHIPVLLLVLHHLQTALPSLHLLPNIPNVLLLDIVVWPHLVHLEKLILRFHLDELGLALHHLPLLHLVEEVLHHPLPLLVGKDHLHPLLLLVEGVKEHLLPLLVGKDHFHPLLLVERLHHLHHLLVEKDLPLHHLPVAGDLLLHHLPVAGALLLHHLLVVGVPRDHLHHLG
jgi:hypothetical protein